ncbi:hypothetical protein PMZ80_005374 [Knufia obscura]|uniref:RING-type E3 ubiquitin transferase n=2 Tax=Knufia TaxID=430999 RepID=A0AAN8ESQ0_9EURO|nr:hypothetical protein PMZ80_005374 [Knufia obscura]KAK5958043.1 hypothetical protein OHC33_001233 [Knufia fluminis]
MAVAGRGAEDVTTHDLRALDLSPPLQLLGHDLESLTPAICVICLDRIADEAIALPCKHDQFHFSCLGTWLQQARACPLCKREVKGIRYRDEISGPHKVFYLADNHSTRLPRRRPGSYNHLPWGQQDTDRRGGTAGDVQQDPALAFRKRVYENKLYSMYVGSNVYSKYRNISPGVLRQEGHLITKAKKWVRRELGVFDFLDPRSLDFGRTDRRATNSEYLLEYIVAILKSIDIKGSAGQAEELLEDFLGRENARLFLHELEAWLRSPFESLKDWDQATQYAEPK